MSEKTPGSWWETGMDGNPEWPMSKGKHCDARSQLAWVSYLLGPPRISGAKCRGEIYSGADMKIRHATGRVRPEARGQLTLDIWRP